MKKGYLIMGLLICLFDTGCIGCVGEKTDNTIMPDSTNLAPGISTDSGGVKHDSSAMKRHQKLSKDSVSK